jgi:hypothetical protein
MLQPFPKTRGALMAQRIRAASRNIAATSA